MNVLALVDMARGASEQHVFICFLCTHLFSLPRARSESAQGALLRVLRASSVVCIYIGWVAPLLRIARPRPCGTPIFRTEWRSLRAWLAALADVRHEQLCCNEETVNLPRFHYFTVQPVSMLCFF